jgi:hypothetical protein
MDTTAATTLVPSASTDAPVEAPTYAPKSGPQIATIAIARRTLLGALRAAGAAMCKDVTRFHLQSVLVEVDAAKPGPFLVFTATDGHTLHQARVACEIRNECHVPRQGIQIRIEDVQRMERALTFKRKADGDALVIVAYDVTRPGRPQVRLYSDDRAPHEIEPMSFSFPPYRQVIPSYSANPRTITGKLGFNPFYMARACDAIRAMGRESNAPEGARFTYGAELDPMRIDWDVIMPMRL